jgi:hypothetical protein
MGDQPVEDRYVHTGQHEHRHRHRHRHPCFEWDSNPRLQCSRGRRQYFKGFREIVVFESLGADIISRKSEKYI